MGFTPESGRLRMNHIFQDMVKILIIYKTFVKFNFCKFKVNTNIHIIRNNTAACAKTFTKYTTIDTDTLEKEDGCHNSEGEIFLST